MRNAGNCICDGGELIDGVSRALKVSAKHALLLI
jgi:hypothetical protein